MYANLLKLDIVAMVDGQRVAIQTDHRDAEEMDLEPELSVLFALTRVINPLRMPQDRPHRVRYTCPHTPSAAVREAIAAAGGQTELGNEALPWDGEVGDPEAIADRAFQALAARVVMREGARLDADVLRALEDETIADKLSRADDEAGYWARVLELAALGGELIRAQVGGRWVRDDSLPNGGWLSTIPFSFQVTGSESHVNLCGKAENMLQHGLSQRVSNLLAIAAAQAEAEEPGSWMPMLKPEGFNPPWPVVTAQLIPEAKDATGLPVIVLCQDRPSSVAYPRAADVADPEARWADAWKNLAAVELQERTLTLDGVQVVALGGSWYAAEKLLDKALMLELQARFQAPMLLAGIPHRGLLLVSPLGDLPDQVAQRMVAICDGQFNNPGEDAAITPIPLVVRDGEVVGMLRAVPTTEGAGDDKGSGAKVSAGGGKFGKADKVPSVAQPSSSAPSATAGTDAAEPAAEEPPPKKRRGFWSWLLGET
jgi:hypothetical protein